MPAATARPSASFSPSATCIRGLSRTSCLCSKTLRSTNGTRILWRLPEDAWTAPIGRDTTSCSFPTSASRTLAPTRAAIRPRWTRTLPDRCGQTQAGDRSARPTANPRKAARLSRVANMSKSGRRSRRTRTRRSGRSTRHANTSPRPSLPMARGRADSARSAPIPIAPCTTRRSSRSEGRRLATKAHRRSSAARTRLPTPPASAYSLPSPPPYLCG